MTKLKKLDLKKKFAGSAIVLTVLVVGLLTTIGIGLANLAPDDYRQSQALEDSLNAENAAWSGVEHALLLLKESRDNNSYFELSQQSNLNANNHPSSTTPSDISGLKDCYAPNNRAACPAFDRLIGAISAATNGSPYRNLFDGFGTVKTGSLSYDLLVWHRREKNIGNITDTDDNYSKGTGSNVYTAFPDSEMSPYLFRNEVKRIDVSSASVINLRWRPVYNANCLASAKYYMVYSFLNPDNTVVTGASNGGRQVLDITSVFPSYTTLSTGGAQTLSLRFMASAATESNITNCFARYSIEVPNANESVDLGFDVVEATGVSNGVRRKIRLSVSRGSGQPLNILDFGLVCETCENFDQYR